MFPLQGNATENVYLYEPAKNTGGGFLLPNPIWENDPYLQLYDPQLDPFANNYMGGDSPYSGNTPDWLNMKDFNEPKPVSDKEKAAAQKKNEAAKQVAKKAAQGDGTDTPPPSATTPDVITGRPWWHWALLAAAGSGAVWYATKKKKKKG